MTDKKVYITSKDIKDVLSKEIKTITKQKIKGDAVGLGICVGLMIILWIAGYKFSGLFNFKLNIIEFTVIYTTIVAAYLFLGYVLNGIFSEKESLIDDGNIFSNKFRNSTFGVFLGFLFFPAGIVISLTDDVALGFRYKEQDIVLAGKLISYLKNMPHDSIEFLYLKKVFIDNYKFSNFELRKVLNFIYKNGLIRVQLDKNKEKADDKARIAFVKEKFEELFSDYISENLNEETDEQN